MSTTNPPGQDLDSLLASALEPLTKPPSTTATLNNTFTTAVQKFNNLAKQQHEQNKPGEILEGFLWSAWHAVFDAAGKTPVDQQEGLVQFLLELKKHDATVTTKDSGGKEAEVVLDSGHNSKLWKDLPIFGWVARERWNSVSAFAPDSKIGRAEQDGLVGLLARLTGEVAKDINLEKTTGYTHGDFSLYGLWSLREVFEASEEGEGSIYIAADGGLVQGADAQLASRGVNQASFWIIFAGEYLWRLSQANKELDDRTGVPGKHFAERKWTGFNKERWAVWKRGFEKAQDWVVGEEAKEGVKAAVEVMAKLE
ncbi:hypothetical protein QBC36DRAFT_337220 [Triangularia setosa]|uniref:Uncharacterized protein n=1 Tax=Triangularia setosa TaxID=2587417 RepID=A0AAN7A4B5_9PEZI|nr:hypothetical protein QBC36DRAFT_337220 [Podospora setosa]